MGFAPIHHAYPKRGGAIIALLYEYGARWNLDTGHEVSEMSFLAAAWGIGDLAVIDGETFAREGTVCRKPPLLALGHALEASEPEIAAAFKADWDLDFTKKLDKIQDGDLVVINTGATHAIVLVFYKEYLAICNRGPGGPTQVYKVDLSKMTNELLNPLNDIGSGERGPAMDFLYQRLPHALAASQKNPICDTLNHGQHQKAQKFEFCAYDSPEAALYTILALQALFRRGKIQEAKAAYKFHTTHFRLEFLNGYLEQIETRRIKVKSVDFELLEKFLLRLKNSNWHPERFAHTSLRMHREITITRLEKAISLKPVAIIDELD